MASLAFKVDETDLTLKVVDGRYSDWKAIEGFQRYLDPKSNLSIDQATTLLHDMLPTADEYENRGQLGMFGCVVLDIARQIPYTHPAQTDLVRLLRNMERSNRLNRLVTDEVYTFYLSMDDFKPSIREWYPWIFDEPGHYINMCAFIARTSTAGITGFTGPNYAIWTMRENLEKDCNNAAYSELVNGAAVWIICAGQWVFNEIVQYPPILVGWFEKAWSNGPLYTGPIVGIQRWKFWKKSFLIAEQTASTNDECKKNARKAYDLMDVIEWSCMF